MKSMEPIFSLRFSLPDRSARDLLRSLHSQLRAAIQDGRLKAGLRLPPSRKLAQELGISRNTAVAAYDLLLSEGYLRAKRGAGTYVSDAQAKLGPGKKRRSQAGRPAQLSEYWRNPPPLFGRDPNTYRYNFGVGLPDASQFPFTTWGRLAGRALRALSKNLSSPAEIQGRRALREAIASHVSFTRAIACEPDDIIVTSGAQQAFDLLARVLVTPGRTTVALEEAHYPPIRHAFNAHRARLLTVPVDDHGIITERLPARTRIVCVTPSHQFPLGSAMSLQRRAELLRFATLHEASIIEDDYDGEFRFGGRSLDALQTLDTDERVFYVGTFAKSMFPELRLGYLITPAWARTALTSAKQITDRHSAVVAQDTLAAFIAEGHLARHVRRMTRVYAERRTVLLDALGRYCADQLQPIPSAAGLHITARLLVPTSAAIILQRAAAAGIKVQSVAQFSTSPTPLNGLSFGYGGIDASHIEAGVRTLARSMKSRLTNRMAPPANPPAKV